MKASIVIEKTGVVDFRNGYEARLNVDKIDFLSELEGILESTGHSQDYDGKFAGRVRLEIESLAD